MRSESDPMHAFQRRNGELYVEDIPLTQLAERFGTPLYVYSRAAFTERYLAYAQALGDHPGMICYAVKANSNLAVLDLLARLGAGFDIVSGVNWSACCARAATRSGSYFPVWGKPERK